MNRIGSVRISKHETVQLRDQPAPYWIVEDLARLWGICSSPKSKQNISSKFSYVTLIHVPRDHIPILDVAACISIARSANNWNTHVSYFTAYKLTYVEKITSPRHPPARAVILCLQPPTFCISVLNLTTVAPFLSHCQIAVIKCITRQCWLKYICNSKITREDSLSGNFKYSLCGIQ